MNDGHMRRETERGMYGAEIQSKRSGGWLALHEVQRRLQILDLHNQELLLVAELFICSNMIFSNSKG